MATQKSSVNASQKKYATFNELLYAKQEAIAAPNNESKTTRNTAMAPTITIAGVNGGVNAGIETVFSR